MFGVCVCVAPWCYGMMRDGVGVATGLDYFSSSRTLTGTGLDWTRAFKYRAARCGLSLTSPPPVMCEHVRG